MLSCYYTHTPHVTCDYASFQRHHHVVDASTCSHCSVVFPSQKQLWMHKITHLQLPIDVDRPYPCLAPGCDMHFKTMQNLRQHMPRHTGEKPFCCPKCSYKSNRKGNLMAHFYGQHKELVAATSDLPPGDHVS